MDTNSSVTQRLFRYDSQAAAESTHQSRSEYLRRKGSASAVPSWAMHATSSVSDVADVRAAEKGAVAKARNILHRQPVASPSSKQLSSPKANSPAKAEANAKPQNVASASTANATNGVKLFTHKGVEIVPETECAKKREPVSSAAASTVSSAAASSNSRQRSSLTRNEQPISVGDILGKSLNITHAQKVQRERYEALEQQRLNAMREQLENNGWTAETSPAGPDRRVTRRIYAGLPVQMPPKAEALYKHLVDHRKNSPLAKDVAN